MARFLAAGLAASLFATPTWGQMARTVQGNWVFPKFPDFTTTLTEGQAVSFAWDSYLQDWFSTYCAPCDTSAVDLWLAGGSDDEYQYNLAMNVDVTQTLSFAWTVDVPSDALQAQQVWSLRFIPHGTKPHGSGDGAEISSPQFQIVAAASSSTTTSASSTTSVSSTSNTASSTSVTDAAASASATSTTATPTPTPTNISGLSTGAQVGIGVGVGVGALILLAVLGALLYRRRKRSKQAPSSVPEVQQQQQPPYGGGYQHYPPNQGQPPMGGYYQQDVKPMTQEADGGSPAPPYIPPMTPSGYKPQPQHFQAHELNANVDPAELPGNHQHL